MKAGTLLRMVLSVTKEETSDLYPALYIKSQSRLKTPYKKKQKMEDRNIYKRESSILLSFTVKEIYQISPDILISHFYHLTITSYFFYMLSN